MDKRWEEKMEAEKKAAEEKNDVGKEEARGEAARTKRMAEEERYRTERKFAVQYHLDMRKVIKTNARKAIRDYMGYLSFYDYLSGATREGLSSKGTDEAITIYKLSDLFASSPLEALAGERSSSPPAQPPSPPSPEPASRPLSARRMQAQAKAQARHAPVEETVSFHPLQPEALCALLLAHTLAQTPDAELRRHAGNAARLVRALTGSPVFAAGAPAAGAPTGPTCWRRRSNAIRMVRPWRALAEAGRRRAHARGDGDGDEAGQLRVAGGG